PSPAAASRSLPAPHPHDQGDDGADHHQGDEHEERNLARGRAVLRIAGVSSTVVRAARVGAGGSARRRIFGGRGGGGLALLTGGGGALGTRGRASTDCLFGQGEGELAADGVAVGGDHAPVHRVLSGGQVIGQGAGDLGAVDGGVLAGRVLTVGTGDDDVAAQVGDVLVEGEHHGLGDLVQFGAVLRGLGEQRGVCGGG